MTTVPDIKFYDLELTRLARDITEWREEKGFETPPGIETATERTLMMEKLMLVVTEVSEAAEDVRHANWDGFCEEIADTMIRLLDICGAANIDISREIAEKMAKNEARPFKHGKTC